MPARLDICKCGKHGHFVLTDASTSPETCYKQHALHLVRIGAQQGLLDADEIPALMEEVLVSTLPMTPDEVNLTFLWNTEVINHAVEEGVRLLITYEDLCRTLHHPTSLSLIPDDFLEVVRKSTHSFQPS